MKKALLISLFFVGHSAMACLYQSDFSVCPGDKVVVEDGDGYVVGVNPIARQVSVDFSRGASRYSGIDTYSID